MSTFPSVLTSYTDPLATDRLNSPSHSGIETSQNSGLEQVEAVIGVEGAASVVGSLQYLVKSPASSGGGHVQGAAYGGTGQTTFTKGDILVGQSPSVLSKLAVGTEGQILSAASGAATGIQWIDNVRPKVLTQASLIAFSAPFETSMFSTSIVGSTLAQSNALRTTVYFGGIDLTSSIVAKVNFGGTSILSAIVPTAAGGTQLGGTIMHTVIASTISAQSHFLEIQFEPRGNAPKVGSVFGSFMFNTTSVQAGAAIQYGMTLTGGEGNGEQQRGFIIERIS